MESNQQYLLLKDELIKSSDRSRNYLIYCFLGGIITFIAIFDVTKDSWRNRRYRNIQKAISFININNQNSPNGKFDLTIFKECHQEYYKKLIKPYELRLYFWQDAPIRHNNIEVNWQNDSTEIQNTVNFIETYVLLEKESLQSLLNQYEHIKEQNLSVVIPILGISFDINDIGLISGISFIFFLYILNFSLYREIDNIGIFFYFIRKKTKDEKDSVLALISPVVMAQLFSLPDVRKYFSKTEIPVLDQVLFDYPTFLKNIAKFSLYVFPMIVYGVVFFVDNSTTFVVNAQGAKYDKIFYIELAFFIIIIIITFRNVRLSFLTDLLWADFIKNSSDEIIIPEAPRSA